MKRLFILTFMLCCCMLQGFAEQYTDENGVTWTCNIDIEKDSACITGVSTCYEEMIIPEKIEFGTNWITVKAIGNDWFINVFEDKKILKKVILPKTLTDIRARVFKGCTNLSEINLENCTQIRNEAFNGCNTLTENVVLDRINIIGENAFSSLEKITIKSIKVPSLGENCFDENTTIFVPKEAINAYKVAINWKDHANHILAIGVKTNYNVTATAQDKAPGLLMQLDKENLNNIITLKVSGTINGYDIMLFRNKMDNLHHLDLSDADIVANPYEYYQGYCTKDNILGDYAFYDVQHLKSISIPKSIKQIGEYTFGSCI